MVCGQSYTTACATDKHMPNTCYLTQPLFDFGGIGYITDAVDVWPCVYRAVTP
jgi:hypothetical protein